MSRGAHQSMSRVREGRAATSDTCALGARPDWTPVSGIFMPNLGTLRVLLLFCEKPPTIGRNSQQLHMIKLSKVPDYIKSVVELPFGDAEE